MPQKLLPFLCKYPVWCVARTSDDIIVFTFRLMRLLIITCLLLAFVFFVRSQAIKYWRENTSITISSQTRQELKLPCITICPIPHRKKISSHNLVNNTVDKWQQENYIRGRDYQFFSDDYQNRYSYDINSDFYGGCSMVGHVGFSRSLQSTFFLIDRTANTSGLQGFTVYLHDESDWTEILFGQTFFSDPVSFNIYFGYESELTLRKKTEKFLNRKDYPCFDYQKNDSQSRCAVKKILDQIYNLRDPPKKEDDFAKNCTAALVTRNLPCIAPFSDLLLEKFGLKSSNYATCANDHEAWCMWIWHLEIMESLRDGRVCQPSCSRSNYNIKNKIVPKTVKYVSDSIDNEIVIVAEYKSTNVRVEEEYLIFDTSDIVSGLGGNLGLFLGFSFYSLWKTLMNNLMKSLLRRARKRSLIEEPVELQAKNQQTKIITDRNAIYALPSSPSVSPTSLRIDVESGARNE